MPSRREMQEKGERDKVSSRAQQGVWHDVWGQVEGHGAGDGPEIVEVQVAKLDLHLDMLFFGSS